MVISTLRFLLVLGYLAPSAAQVSSETPSDAIGLLHIAKTLADSGRLDDPTYVEQVLRTTLTAHIQPQIGKSCGKTPVSRNEQTGAYYNIVLYNPAKDFWFRRSPHGVTLHYRQQPFFINDAKAPIVTMSNPTFIYSVDKAVHCGRTGEQQHSTEAIIQFAFIPGFSCVTDSQLRAIFSNLVEPQMVVDGYTRLKYVANKAIVSFDPLLMEDGSSQPRCEIGVVIRGAYPDR